MNFNKNVTIILEDGSQFNGHSFGTNKNVTGEIVFNSAMNGYAECLTDPAYLDQIMILTYPLVGNYGIPKQEIKNGISNFLESEKIHTSAVIVSDYSKECSHWNAETTLSDWLIEENIVGVCDVDTRAITKLLREKGNMKAKIISNSSDNIDFVDTNLVNQVEIVSCKKIITYNDGANRKKIVLIDCGVSHSIIRNFIAMDLCIIRVPWDFNFNEIDFDGLFISNGPGNPDFCDKTLHHLKQNLNNNKPICGIGLGHQILAKSTGAKIYKLKNGHRSNNQPVRMLGTNNCFITSQNHNYAVDNSTLDSDWKILFANINDETNEGIIHKNKPFFSTQFYPEICNEIGDTEFIFNKFVKNIENM